MKRPKLSWWFSAVARVCNLISELIKEIENEPV